MVAVETAARDHRPARPRPSRRTVWITVGVVVAAVAACVAVVVGAGHGAATVYFQDLTGGPGYGRLVSVPADDPGAARAGTGLACDRVYLSAGHGLCLSAVVGPTPSARLLVLGRDLRTVREVPLDGVPDRARVSTDGRYGAATVFAPRDAEDDDDGYTARTVLLDMANGTVLGDLATFTVLRDGAAASAPDVGLGCVTFAADSNRFYATLADDGHSYLVQGDVAARTLTVQRDGVDCPSLSPDGTRLGFRKRMNADPAAPVWRYHVLDLRTGHETALAETGSVDDQLEWLDDATVLYGVQDAPHAVYAVPSDGTEAPRLYLADARSPVVVHGQRAADAAAADARQPVRQPPGAAVFAPATAPVGTPFTQSIVVTGRGDTSDVVVDDVVTGPGRPVAATADAPAGSAGGHGCTVVAQEHRARCDLPRLPAGVSWRVTVTVIGTAAGTVTGTVQVSADGTDGAAADPGAPVRTTSAEHTLQTASSAARTSATRSAGSSQPAERRSRPGLTSSPQR